MSNFWYDAGAWVQAIGAIAAVIGSAWFAARDSRAARQQARPAWHAQKA